MDDDICLLFVVSIDHKNQVGVVCRSELFELLLLEMWQYSLLPKF